MPRELAASVLPALRRTRFLLDSPHTMRCLVTLVSQLPVYDISSLTAAPRTLCPRYSLIKTVALIREKVSGNCISCQDEGLPFITIIALNSANSFFLKFSLQASGRSDSVGNSPFPWLEGTLGWRLWCRGSKCNTPCCARFTPDTHVTFANPTQMLRAPASQGARNKGCYIWTPL
jgi:hypothetical protein